MQISEIFSTALARPGDHDRDRDNDHDWRHDHHRGGHWQWDYDWRSHRWYRCYHYR